MSGAPLPVPWRNGFSGQSIIRVELYSSRLTLLEMMKTEKDPAVLEVVRASLRLRIERDTQKGGSVKGKP